MRFKTVMASSWLAQWFIRTTQLADVICFGGKLIMSTVVTQTLFFYVLVKQVCLLNSNQSYWQDLVGFSSASLKKSTWLVNFILKWTWHTSLIDFYSKFWVKCIARKKVLLNVKPRIPENCWLVLFFVD